jgi:hypothetical protein
VKGGAMKYFTYLVICVMCITTGALFYLKQPNGETWLSGELFSSEAQRLKNEAASLSEHVLDIATGAAEHVSSKMASFTDDKSNDVVKVYKWKDEEGIWHFSDTPIMNQLTIVEEFDPKDITVIAAEDTSILKRASDTEKVKSKEVTTPSAYNPETVKKLFSDAEKTKEMLEQRTKALEDI